MAAIPGVPTASELIEQIEAFGERPVALQALWDGDTQGWFLELQAVVPSGASYASKLLATLSFGGDFRLFEGSVPPWPEARVAAELGAALAAHLGVPFWFPAPHEPDDECPRWWERDRAIACASCQKPILPPVTPYRPNDLCQPCHQRKPHT